MYLTRVSSVLKIMDINYKMLSLKSLMQMEMRAKVNGTNYGGRGKMDNAIFYWRQSVPINILRGYYLSR